MKKDINIVDEKVEQLLDMNEVDNHMFWGYSMHLSVKT